MRFATEDAAVVLNAVKADKGAYGYNAGTGEYGDGNARYCQTLDV